MQDKFIYLEQTKDQLPLLETDLFYVNHHLILNTSQCREEILSNLDTKLKFESLFGMYTNPGGTYPRFHRETSSYKLFKNPVYPYLTDLKSFKKLDFSSITDSRSLDLLKFSQSYEKIYLFWSGGIDSTVILCSILKNWSAADLEKLTIVLNDHSISENNEMYLKYIDGKIKTEQVDRFFSGDIKFSHDCIYVDGNVGDSVSYLQIDRFDNMFPGYYLKPWKSNIDVLIKYFHEFTTEQNALETYKRIVRSLNSSGLEVETIFDFLWWMTFNWLHEKMLYNILWQYTPCFFANPNMDIKKFLESNMFQWFNGNDYQDWMVGTIGTKERIGDSIFTNKYAFKKYIFDFNKDEQYFLYKKKEESTPRIKTSDNHIILCAIDTDYNYYYRYTHEKIWPPK